MKKALWRKAFPEMPPVYLSIYKIYTNYKNLQSGPVILRKAPEHHPPQWP